MSTVSTKKAVTDTASTIMDKDTGTAMDTLTATVMADTEDTERRTRNITRMTTAVRERRRKEDTIIAANYGES